MYGHLYEIVRQRAAEFPQVIALGGEDGLTWRTLDSRELLRLIDRLAVELSAHDIKESDRVILWAPNHWRTPIYLFALWKLGAVVVPFDREMNPEAGASIIESVEPQQIIAGFDERPVWTNGRQVATWWEPGSKTQTPPGDDWEPPAETLAAIFFTSGTTGNPKGCMITHGNLCSQVDGLRTVMDLNDTSRLASILPLSHLFELTCGLLYPLSRGAAVHYIPSRRGPDIVRVLSQQRITHMIAVPQLLTAMGDALMQQLKAKLPGPLLRGLLVVASRLPLPVRHGLFWMVHRKIGGQLRTMASGGAALPAQTQLLWERLGVRVLQGYGASECSPVIASATADSDTPIGSVGKPIQGVDLKLSPDNELLVRGPNVMRGYWKDPERTAEVLNDGWYATGDLATIDLQGNIFLSGRAKDLIALPSGMKVWPQDVEDVLRAHPMVKDAVVIPVPTQSGGAVLHAYLIPAVGQGGQETISAIVAECNGRLAQHQRMATVSWWRDGDFPRTSTLKVRRNLLPLPENAQSVEIESVQAADDPVGQAIAGVAHLPAVQPTQTLGEIGIDSLGLVDLALSLEEKTGKAVGDGDLHLDMTVEQVRSYLSQAASLGNTESHQDGPSEPPLWPYTWGRIFRALNLPISLLYRMYIPRTIVLGGEHLRSLPKRVVFAGTHRGFADTELVRVALERATGRAYANRLIPVAGAEGWAGRGIKGWFAILAYGSYPLRRLADRETSLRHLVDLAGRGNPILIYPQGVHARPDEEIADSPRVRFHPGFAHLADALDAVVVPFGPAGPERVLPQNHDGSFIGRTIAGLPVSPQRTPLAIAFGPPVTFESGETPQAFASRMQAICYDLTRKAEQVLESGSS